MENKVLIFGSILLLLMIEGLGQDSDIFRSMVERKQSTAKKAADQEINFKSIVTDLIGGRYYQALIKNGILQQGDGEIKIKSTIYGIVRVFDTARREREHFIKGRWMRNIQIGAGASFLDNNRINSLNSSFTIALLNKREYKGPENLFAKNNLDFAAIDSATLLIDKAIMEIENQVNNDSLSKKQKEKLIEQYAALLKDFNNTTDFQKLKGLITDSEINELKKKWSELTTRYDELQKKLSGAPILTYTYDGNYNGNTWQKLDNRLEFLVGFGKNEDTVRKYDFYAGVFYNLNHDTLNKASSLNRRVFNVKVGVNAVLWKDKSDGSSIVEAFGGAEFQNINKGIYTGEKMNALKFDVTLSFRLAKNLYLPFQVKYNANSGHFEGYLDLKYDIVNIFK